MFSGCRGQILEYMEGNGSTHHHGFVRFGFSFLGLNGFGPGKVRHKFCSKLQKPPQARPGSLIALMQVPCFVEEGYIRCGVAVSTMKHVFSIATVGPLQDVVICLGHHLH